MILRAAIVLAVVLATSAVAHAGKRDCVAIAKGKVVYADASKRHPVGTTAKKIAAEVEQRKGAWVKLRLDDLAETDSGGHVSYSHVYVFVRKRDAKRGKCPLEADGALVGLIDSWTELRWRHGEPAGSVYVSDFASATRCNGDDVVIGEVKLRCGAWSPVDGLAVDVCAEAWAAPGSDAGAALRGDDPCAE